MGNSPFVIKAQTVTITSPPGVPGTIGELISRVIPVVLVVAGVLLFGLFIYGGFSWMTSAGDSNKVKTAQSIMLNAVIGIAIIVCSALLVKIVGHLIGYEGLGIL